MPFGQLGDGRLTVEGSDLILKPKAVEHIGLACMNPQPTPPSTAHYHYRQARSCSLTLETIGSEAANPDRLARKWRTTGEGARTPGFGHMVITHLAPKALEGNVELNYEIDGLRWTLVAPTTSVTANQSGQKWS
jgi:hypothetical protein